MPAVDFASDDQFDKTAPGIESPARETMQPGEHINQDQFGAHITDAPAAPAAPRHPRYIGKRSLADWRTSPEGNHAS